MYFWGPRASFELDFVPEKSNVGAGDYSTPRRLRVIHSSSQGQIHVLRGLKITTFWRTSLRKKFFSLTCTNFRRQETRTHSCLWHRTWLSPLLCDAPGESSQRMVGASLKVIPTVGQLVITVWLKYVPHISYMYCQCNFLFAGSPNTYGHFNVTWHGGRVMTGMLG